jgi:hypothetical protein
VHCFAGVRLRAKSSVPVGSSWDLFPPIRSRTRFFAAAIKRPFPAADVLEALADEADVLCVALHDSDWGCR